jgi:hypothetical protein
MSKLLTFLSLLLLLTAGCEESSFKTSEINQLVLFQVEYTNYAWGYSHHGIIIDSAGNVRRFNFPENWKYPDDSGYLSEADMNENFDQLGNVTFTVDRDTLLNYFNMTRGASEGKLSDPYNHMADAGVAVYTGYFYYASEKKYKQVLIKQWGDWAIDNNSKEAESLYRWLSETYSNAMGYNIK